MHVIRNVPDDIWVNRNRRDFTGIDQIDFKSEFLVSNILQKCNEIIVRNSVLSLV